MSESPVVNNFITAQTYASEGANVSLVQNDCTAMAQGGAVETRDPARCTKSRCLLATITPVLAVLLIGGSLAAYFTQGKGSDIVEPDTPTTHKVPPTTTVTASTIQPGCDAVPLVKFGEVSCTNDSEVGSVCKTNCVNNHKLEGSNVTLCAPNRTWTLPFPTCKCSRCKSGDSCQYSTAYSDTRRGLSDGRKSIVKYAGFTMTCETYIEGGIGDFLPVVEWKCACTDDGRGSQTCKHYKSRVGACEHASSQLIRNLVAAGVYPAPCDGLIDGC